MINLLGIVNAVKVFPDLVLPGIQHFIDVGTC
jgi:hypothetical protein